MRSPMNNFFHSFSNTLTHKEFSWSGSLPNKVPWSTHNLNHSLGPYSNVQKVSHTGPVVQAYVGIFLILLISNEI
jgi:hypothetical protein